jgi:NAD dependent epimerase/dehydratase family enzyme
MAIPGLTGLILFTIANIIVSVIGTFIVRKEYPKSNKYFIIASQKKTTMSLASLMNFDEHPSNYFWKNMTFSF